MDAPTLIVLIAPNISPLMGGEGIKALKTFQYFKRLHPNTLQITHGRNRAEIKDLSLNDVYFVDDDVVALFLWKSIFFRFLLNIWFSRKAIALAEKLAETREADCKNVIIHQTGPNSLVLPRVISSKFNNSFGPLNGNIHYPELYRYRESFIDKLKRLCHYPLQKINAILFQALSQADVILAAGGRRTVESLIAAGCDSEKLVNTIDSGVDDRVLARARIVHHDENLHFVHFGRLVNFKATDLVIKALSKTKLPITVDIIGDGPELPRCKQLVKALGLSSRVNFIPWYSHDDLLDSLSHYRGFILPSLADSNGIVVQEAMAIGLPAICLDWAGPRLLIENGVDGYLIPVDRQEVMLSNMAACMDDLAHNGDKAERFSISARSKAKAWQWTSVAEEWLTHLDNIVSDTGCCKSQSLDEGLIKDKPV